jgi:hypothetical protein
VICFHNKRLEASSLADIILPRYDSPKFVIGDRVIITRYDLHCVVCTVQRDSYHAEWRYYLSIVDDKKYVAMTCSESELLMYGGSHARDVTVYIVPVQYDHHD